MYDTIGLRVSPSSSPWAVALLLAAGCGPAVADDGEDPSGTSAATGRIPSDGGADDGPDDQTTTGPTSDGGPEDQDMGDGPAGSTGSTGSTGPAGSTGDDGQATGGPKAAPGEIVCGEELCDSSTEFCMACSHDGELHAHCLTPSADTVDAEWQQAFQHGCSGGAPLLIACDTQDDCEGEAECHFIGGEFGYAYCNATKSILGAACEDDAMCADQGYECGPYDPLNYFSPLQDALGWLPQACVQP